MVENSMKTLQVPSTLHNGTPFYIRRGFHSGRGELDLHQVDFTSADLSGADLSDAYLRGAKLVATKLTGTKLRRARLNQAWIMGAVPRLSCDLSAAPAG